MSEKVKRRGRPKKSEEQPAQEEVSSEVSCDECEPKEVAKVEVIDQLPRKFHKFL